MWSFKNVNFVGPTLRNCSQWFDTVNLPSDVRVADWIDRLYVDRKHISEYLPKWRLHETTQGFHPSPRCFDLNNAMTDEQISFHGISGDAFGQLFDAVATVSHRHYYDWQAMAFRSMMAHVGTDRAFDFLFRHEICWD